MIIAKRTSATRNFPIYHPALGNDKKMYLNDTQAESSSTNWNSTTPTSSVFSIGSADDINGSGSTYIAYVFAEKTGYSKFGSYTGNGDANGAFVYTGFKPAWVIIKQSSAIRDWIMVDNKRDPDNVVSNRLFPNNSDAQNTNNNMLDFTSNGFKIRNTNTTANASGGTYIYMAFGQSLVGSNNVPCTAR